MFSKNSILRLNKDILQRFEHNLNDGTIILYNVKTRKIWFGNYSSYDLIKLLDGKKNLDCIYSVFKKQYEGYTSEEIVNSVNTIFEELLEKNFLETV